MHKNIKFECSWKLGPHSKQRLTDIQMPNQITELHESAATQICSREIVRYRWAQFIEIDKSKMVATASFSVKRENGMSID